MTLNNSELLLVDCLINSPHFRENIRQQQRKIDSTKRAVRNIVDECQHVIEATRALSSAYQKFAQSLHQFAKINPDEDNEYLDGLVQLLLKIETERSSNFPHQLEESFVKPLKRAFLSQSNNFGNQHQNVKEKRNSENLNLLLRQTNVGMSSSMAVSRVSTNSLPLPVVSEKDANQVDQVLEFQMKKNYEFADALVCFINQHSNLYHLNFEAIANSQTFQQMKVKLQNMQTRIDDNEMKIRKTNMTILHHPVDMLRTSLKLSTVMCGHLSIKKSGIFRDHWSQCFCELLKQTGHFTIMEHGIPYNCQAVAATPNDDDDGNCDFTVSVRCDLGPNVTYGEEGDGEELHNFIFRCKDEAERSLWLEAFGWSPEKFVNLEHLETAVDETIEDLKYRKEMHFLSACFTAIEKRSLQTPGLYRVPGSKSKVSDLLERLLGTFWDFKKFDFLQFDFF